MIDIKDVTIIIPHLGKSEESRYALGQCTASLHETVPDMKKIVVVNGMVFDEKFDLYSCPENTSIMTLQEQGQCKAVNAAVATTNTPWIFITNDDMIYAPGWFEKLTENIGDKLCVSPQLVEPREGAPTFVEYFCGGAGGDFDKSKWIQYAYAHSLAGGHQIRTGFNLPFLIKRELWDTIGGYDINYDPWGSNGDSDLEYKIRLAGVQPYQNTNCVVYHFGQTSGTFHPDNRPYWQKNWDYFIEKWGFERESAPKIWTADFDIPMDKLKLKPDWMGKYED